MSAAPKTVEEQIASLKSTISNIARKMAQLPEKRRELLLQAAKAYRDALANIRQNIRWVVKDILWSKVLAAESTWAPIPAVKPAQVTLTYPLRTQHPVLGEIPYVQSLVTELRLYDLHYLDIIDALIEGNWKLLYGGEEYRPQTTSHMSSCTPPDQKGKGYFCITEPVDGKHKCLKFFTDHECAVQSSSITIPDEGCDVILIVFEGHELVTGCLSDKCCDETVADLSELQKDTDYDFVTSVPIARVYVQNNCSNDAVLVTPYGNVTIRAGRSRNLIIAQYRGMRDACSFEPG